MFCESYLRLGDAVQIRVVEKDCPLTLHVEGQLLVRLT